jgi:hypothetical protein
VHAVGCGEEGRVMSRRLRNGVWAVIGLLAVSLLITAAGGQTKKSTRKPKKPTAAELARAKADSIARFLRADSLERVQRALAAADSVRRADSLALAQDSLRIANFRTIPQTAFTVGERLVFDVNYGLLTAGEAVMAVADFDSVAGRKVYRVEFTVNSLPSFSWIYKVEDRYYTYIDVQAIVPWKFRQHIREGTYRRDFIAEFDQYRNVATTTEGVYPIPPYVHDIMSAFYFARTLDFASMNTGDGIDLHNFYKDKSHELRVRFLGRQEIEVAAGTFRTVVVEPLVKEGGLFKSEGRIVIWLSDDERKIPVRVNTKVVIGSIDTELKSYSGLAGPLRSRVR